MEKISRLDEEQRNNLVAYLDGELPERESQEIEQVLARSEVARHEVETLSRAYDALSLLPSVRASQEFTRKTVTALRVAAAPRPPQPNSRWAPAAVRVLVLAGWGAALVLLACGGYLVANRWIPNDADKLLEEFPIVEKLEALREAKQIEFLRALDRQRVFSDSAQTAPVGSRRLSPAERQRRIAAMSESERARLTRNIEEYQRLPEQQREQVRVLAAALSLEGEAVEKKLRQIMDDYQAWLSTLTEAERTELEHIADPDARAREVARLRKPAVADQFSTPDQNSAGNLLSSSDLAAIMRTLEKRLEPHLDPEQTAELANRKGLQRDVYLLKFIRLEGYLKYEYWGDHKLFDAMVNQISTASQSRALRHPGPLKKRQLMQLIIHSILVENDRLKPDEQTLEDFFDSLLPDERDPVMSPPQEQPELLTALYKERHPEIYLSRDMREALKRIFHEASEAGPNGERGPNGEIHRNERGRKPQQPNRGATERPAPDRAPNLNGRSNPEQPRRGEEPARQEPAPPDVPNRR